ncbi:MAG: hypothetical protein AAB916_02445 [Patescibacteria group bacterium]
MTDITVIATFAQDRYIYLKDGTQIVTEGGPALWITRTLMHLSMPYAIVAGTDKAIVDITIGDTGEQGTIVFLSPINTLHISPASAYIVSTIGDEFELGDIATLNGLVAIDAQGFVRGALLNGHSSYTPPFAIRERIAILKATEQEVGYLDAAFVKEQKHRMLLVTKGSLGFELFAFGRYLPYPSNNAITPPNTIGAGDVLLSAFVVRYLRSRDPLEAGYRARKDVEEFLSQK